jgi:hypothetical protein
VSCSPVEWLTRCPVPSEVISLITMSTMVLEAIRFQLFFNFLYLFFPFFLYSHSRTRGVIWNYCDYSWNISAALTVPSSHIVPAANMFCYISLSNFMFCLEILDPPCRCLEEKLCLAIHTEKPAALLLFSIVNEGRKKINKCKNKHKWSLRPPNPLQIWWLKNYLTQNWDPATHPPCRQTCLPTELLWTM